ncbi:hypothetical protein K435DRAFT_800558 [Dendrothele bispora CBS 962.96]|uniref:RRM domain-containing protein n=1 Tax=Dendrothele bispora (strain CBS 962.96) TaxID=1314807 RepID=A0A4S8LSB4_DENBC|nr:hypothetical protein K435DRAFT_800558 [Dendrothele bispora CBS 962.96]
MSIYQDRKPCIIPPAVQDVAALGGWERFTETMDNEGRPGRKREIYLEDKPLIPRELVHDINVFGMPGPDLRYWADDQFHLRLPASNWIYLSKLPNPRTIGQTAANPDPSLLPLIDEPPPEAIVTTEQVTEVDTATPPLGTDDIPLMIEDVRMNSPTLDEDSPLQEDTPSAEEQDRPPSPYPEPPTPESVQFSIIWSEDIKNPIAPTLAPTMLLKFLGFHDVSLIDFRAFLHETLAWLPVEIKVTRIIRVTREGKLEFWLKFFDGSQAAWAIRAYHRFWTTDGYIIQLKLIALEEWRAIDQQSGIEEWSLPKPLLPKEEQEMEECLSEEEEPSLSKRLQDLPSAEIGNSRADQLLDSENPTPTSGEQSLDRLQDPPTSMSLLQRTKETLEDRLVASSAQSSRKRNRRGGTRKRSVKEILGPLPAKDPENIETWDARNWVLQNCPQESEN